MNFEIAMIFVRPNLQIIKIEERMSSWTGLYNQLFAFTNAIIRTVSNNKKFLITDGFLTDIKLGQHINLSQIIDFNLTSDNILKTFRNKIQIFDRERLPIQIDKELVENEFRNGDRFYNFERSSRFPDYFKCLVFRTEFYEIVDSLDLDKMNIIHFRYENDWINHIANHHFSGNKEKCRNTILESYLNSLEYLIPELKTCILTSDSNSISQLPLENIYHLNTDHKDRLLIDKFGFTGREMRGILDFIIAVRYASLFIGCFGSTFSMAIKMSIDRKCYLLSSF